MAPKEPGHLKKECPKLSEERRKELQDLYQMKIERKGKGTGRKKTKRELEKDLDGNKEQQSDPSEPKAKKSKRKKVKKDKTGNIVQEGEGLFQGFRVLQQDVQKLRDLAAKLTKDQVPFIYYVSTKLNLTSKFFHKIWVFFSFKTKEFLLQHYTFMQ